MHSIDVAYSYACRVHGLSVCWSITTNHAKTDEPIEMSFGVVSGDLYGPKEPLD